MRKNKYSKGILSTGLSTMLSTILSLVCAIIIIFAFAAVIHSRTYFRCDGYIEYTVKAGETYWSIAEKFAENVDIRVYIHHMIKVNGIPPEKLRPGDILKIPIAKRGL